MIKIKMSQDGLFYFVICASNGQVIATSETYTRKGNCMKGIQVALYNALQNAMQGTEEYQVIDETI